MKEGNAIGDRIAGAQISPLVEMPLRESGNELRPICEKLDFHTTRSVI